MDDLLNKIKAIHKFRDPIYGYIWLTDAEVEIIDTPIFQRLRRVSQLALTKYVYPTAEHSRFVHSLGVLQCATNIFLELLKSEDNAKNLNKSVKNNELPSYFKTLRYAALLHDIGHPLFSHACEKLLIPGNLNHEDVGQYIIKNYHGIDTVINSDGCSSTEVAALLSDTYIKKYRPLKLIISGVFDADRADYLLRDSYNCGVSYGLYDYIRFISSFYLKYSRNEPTILAIDEGSIYTLEAFLLARFHYNMQVPFHRTRVGYDKVLERYLSDLCNRKKLSKICKASKNQITSMDFKKFQYFDDYEIFSFIKKDSLNGDNWAKVLMRENHLTPVFNKDNSADEDLSQKKQWNEYSENLEAKGLIENKDFIKYSEKIDSHNIIRESDEIEHDKYSVYVFNKQTKKTRDFMDYSPLIESIKKKAVCIYRVYVTDEYKELAIETLKKLQ